MNKFLKELALWAFIALPYVYLAIIWNELPVQVPIHFNLEGVADNWSNKSTLLYIPGAIGIGIYLLVLFIPILDPKKKIQQMEGKYYAFRLILTIFFSLLSTYIIFTGKSGSLKPNILFALLGALFAMFGNYFQTVRPNYFLGIRTPWTLENEQVWKKTHRLGGRLWIVGGILIVLLAFFINNNQMFLIIFGVIILILVIVPVVYSYTEFKKINKT
jgi:uncharacterized membrane protein